jgi:hypothetical protein
LVVIRVMCVCQAPPNNSMDLRQKKLLWMTALVKPEFACNRFRPTSPPALDASYMCAAEGIRLLN